MSAIAGRVLLIPKGNYDSATTYTMLDMVVYNGSSYICKQECTGVVPTNTTYWMLNASGSAVAYINDIGDVVITNVSNGQVLMYDSTTQKWVNGTITTTLSGLTDTQIASLQNGQVLKYNSTSQKWENAEDKGGLLPHLIIISETGESVVKAVKGTTEIIATETSTGHYECDVPEFGTWTIHAVLNGEDATVNLVVDTVKVYTVDDSHFHADITVTYPSGGTCSCSKTGETTMYATGSPYTFTVHSSGTWTITVTVDGKTYTQTVSLSTSGQTESLTIPVGSTVTPTDDVKTLLHCAGISGSSITTLDGLLADNTTLLAVINSHNAIDYLVRSTSFASNEGLVPVMTSATTPSGVVICNQEESSHHGWYAFDGNTNESNFWSNASSGFPSYLGYNFGEPVKICRLDLTSRSSRLERACKNYKIQGSNNDTDWTDIYSGTFAQQVNNTISFANDVAYSYYRLYIVDVYSGSECNIVEMQFYKFTQSIPENSTAMAYIGLNNYASNTLLADSTWLSAIANSEYIESVLNVKVPTMTSNTTPSGEVFSGGSKDTNRPDWAAFDKVLTLTNGNYWLPKSAMTHNYIGYIFTHNVKIRVVKVLLNNNNYSARTSINITVQSGVNKDNFTDISANTQCVTPSVSTWTTIICNEQNESKNSFRLYDKNGVAWHTDSGASTAFIEVQFYGREDV